MGGESSKIRKFVNNNERMRDLKRKFENEERERERERDSDTR